MCSECGVICEECGLCEECCTAKSAEAGCAHGTCISGSDWEEHWEEEHAGEEHSHAYTGYEYDDEGHWRECSVGTCDHATEPENHSYGEWTVVRKASCTIPGSKERECIVCGHTETGDIPAEHSYEWKYDSMGHWKECKAAGCGEILTGSQADHNYGSDKLCDVCGYEKVEYAFIDGADGKWSQEDGGELSFHIDGSLRKFVDVKVDDKVVDPSLYTVESGSTIVTLHEDYMKTLTTGKHKLTVVFNDGEASTYFEIVENFNGGSGSGSGSGGGSGNGSASGSGSGSGSGSSSGSANTQAPQTGDRSPVGFWAATLCVSGCVLALIKGKKKEQF